MSLTSLLLTIVSLSKVKFDLYISPTFRAFLSKSMIFLNKLEKIVELINVVCFILN
jgi:hypothetical protein